MILASSYTERKVQTRWSSASTVVSRIDGCLKKSLLPCLLWKDVTALFVLLYLSNVLIALIPKCSHSNRIIWAFEEKWRILHTITVCSRRQRRPVWTLTKNFHTEQLQQQPSTWNVVLNINDWSFPQYIIKVAPLITFLFLRTSRAMFTVAGLYPFLGPFSASFECGLLSGHQTAQIYSPLQTSLW